MKTDLSEVLARNAKAIRGSASQDDVARAARRYGLSWGTGRVSDLEHGRVSPTVPTLVALALALAEVRGEYIHLSDLLRSDEEVALTASLTVTGDELRSFLDGAQISHQERYPASHGASLLAQVANEFGEPEERLARDLGLDRNRLITEMAALWGDAFHVIRDKQAGLGANAQKKGRVARQLKAELKSVIAGDDNE